MRDVRSSYITRRALRERICQGRLATHRERRERRRKKELTDVVYEDGGGL
jgi:hypothetical protein